MPRYTITLLKRTRDQPALQQDRARVARQQCLTGARSGELCAMRTGDIDTSDKHAWVYRPQKHKTAHHDQVREILLGPRAREIPAPFLKPDLRAFVFSPAEAAEWHLERRRTRGKASSDRSTPDAPARRRRAGSATRRPGQQYTNHRGSQHTCDR